MQKLLTRFVAVSAALLLPLGAHALDSSRPIRIVVSYAAGSVIDISTRIIGDGLARELGQTVIVENKPGGDAVIGMLDVVNSKPDGNTLLSDGFGGLLIPPLIKKNFPADVDKQLTKIGRAAEFANVLIVNKDLPVNSVEELVAYSKANPGQLNFGASGVATSSRLTAEMFMQQTGADLTHVPYNGSPAALNDLMAGVVQVMFANLPTTVGLVESGDVKPLAVTSPERAPQMPQVPTMIEAGLSDYVMTSWNAVFGPAGMSDEDVAKISAALSNVVLSPEVSERLSKVGFFPVGEQAEEFAIFFDADRDRWKAVIDTAGLAE